MTDRTTFDPDALRKEFADYCTDVEPGIKAKAPRLNQLETLALIGMTLFQAAKELKAEKVDQAARIADLEASLQASRRAALEEAAKLMNPYDDEGTVGAMNANAIRALAGTET
jgi:uncharacterized protein YyaL (SSP411 family)